MKKRSICVILLVLCMFGAVFSLTGCSTRSIEIKFDTEAHQTFECGSKTFYNVVVSFSGKAKIKKKHSVAVRFEFDNADVVITEGDHEASLVRDDSTEGVTIFTGAIEMHEDKAIEFQISPYRVGEANIVMSATAIGNKFKVRNGQRNAPVTFSKGKLSAPVLTEDLNSIKWTKSEYAGGYRIFRVDENGENPIFVNDFASDVFKWDLEPAEVPMYKNTNFVVQAISGDIESFDNSDYSNIKRIVVVD